jgi:hypothetical protein
MLLQGRHLITAAVGCLLNTVCQIDLGAAETDMRGCSTEACSNQDRATEPAAAGEQAGGSSHQHALLPTQLTLDNCACSTSTTKVQHTL